MSSLRCSIQTTRWLPLESRSTSRRSAGNSQCLGVVPTDMVAVDAQAVVRDPRYADLTGVPQGERYFFEEVCRTTSQARRTSGAQRLAHSAQRPVYVGEIFLYMVLGQSCAHVHGHADAQEALALPAYSTSVCCTRVKTITSTCARPCTVRWRCWSEPSVLYRVGAEDQLTSPNLAVYRARRNRPRQHAPARPGAGSRSPDVPCGC